MGCPKENYLIMKRIVQTRYCKMIILSKVSEDDIVSRGFDVTKGSSSRACQDPNPSWDWTIIALSGRVALAFSNCSEQLLNHKQPTTQHLFQTPL